MTIIAILLIGMAGGYSVLVAHRTQKSLEPMSKNVHNRLQKLWVEAHKNIQNHQWLRAERTLLTILKFDRKDASAYNRLGIIYAKQKDFGDAIKCFEIAKSIKPSASNFHNLGLLYLETANYEKAQVAFEEAIKLDSDSSLRYIALAKVFSKTDRYKQAIEALKHAVELDKNSKNYALLSEAYYANMQEDEGKKYSLISKKYASKESTKKTTKKDPSNRRLSSASRAGNRIRSRFNKPNKNSGDKVVSG